MLNIKKINDNKIKIIYNTINGVKEEFKDLEVLADKNGDNIVPYYSCLYSKNKLNYFLNTVLQLQEDFINKLEFPKLVFYDIETDRGADDLDNSEVNSIAWIGDNNKEYCLVKGVDGSEKEIIKEFVDYCTQNNIIGIVGHNSFKFDNKVMINRCKKFKINYSLFYNDCNLDTMTLASFLQFKKDTTRYISLNNLSTLLGVEDNKTDTGVYNPINLYNEAIKKYKDGKEEKLKLFREYNIQDVRLCKTCFDKMNVKQQLTELFNQTLCPFNKMQYNTVLLNHYTCKYLLKKGIKIPKSVNKKINKDKFKNRGGETSFIKSDKLQVYNRVLVADIVSYYPHLLMLINADPYNEYENINRKTGEIKPFKKNDCVGLIAELSQMLYESRARTKNEMKQTEDKELKKQLNYEQLTKKIIVNSLYGAIGQKGKNNYILKNELIASTITQIGRDILKHIIEKFGAVYGKTDSVFIPLKEGDKPELILNFINIEVNKFLNSKYNLDNTTSNGQLVRFEIDSIIDKLLIKDGGNYVKIINGEYKYKGSSFKGSNLSDFEMNNIKTVLNNIELIEAGKENKLKEILFKNTRNFLETYKDLKFFCKTKKLSDRQKKQQIIAEGINYMENEGINYNYGFNYLYCCVKDSKYNYIMFPDGYTPDFKINPVYVYDLLIKQMYNLKIIDKDTKKNLIKKYNIKIINKKKPNKDTITLDNYNENDKGYKIENSSYNFLYNKIGDKIKELTIFKLGEDKGKPPKNWQKLTKTNIKSLKNYNGNIGIVFNPKNKYKYGFLDIDGFKKDLTEKDNRKFKKDLYNLLKNNKEIYEHSIVQKTQSGGYHFIFKHNETDKINNEYMNGFKTPNKLKEDYNFKNHDKLGNESKSGAIEIFINQIKYCMVYPSKIKPNKEYEIIHKGKKFGEPVKNIKKQLTKVFGNNEVITKKYENKSKSKVKKENKNNINSELKKKFLKDDIVFNLLVEEFKKQTGNHNTILATYTAILKSIGLTDGEAESYMEKVLTGANDNTNEHTNQINSYINSNDGTKPNFREYLNSNELNDLLDTYLNPVYRTKKSKKSKEHKTKKKQKSLYEEVKGSFAEYAGKIPYNLTEDFLQHIKKKINTLSKELDGIPLITFSHNNLGDIEEKSYFVDDIIQGGLYHYGFTDSDRAEIFQYGELPIREIDGRELIYGFPTLENCIDELTKETKEDKKYKKLKEKVELIKKFIKLNPSLNPIYYTDGEKNGYCQIKKQLIKNNNNEKKILNCSFQSITKHKQLGNKTGIELDTKYDFNLILYNNKNVILKNYTIPDLLGYIKKKNLNLTTKNSLETDIVRFINFVDNKGDIKYIEKAYITGFVVEQTQENHYKLFDNFPDLNKNIINKYTLEDGIKLLNTIYTEVFNEDMRFIKVFKWYLVHSLREIFKEFNLFNSILYQLILYGYGGTGKSLALLILSQMFTSIVLIENVIEADTIASVDRVIGKSTLPLILDDPVTPLRDYDKISKKYNFGDKTRAKAKEQYGNEVNRLPVTRQSVLVVNDSVIDNSDSGLARRRYFLGYTKSDIFLDSAKDKLRQITYTFGSEKPILKLNTIGITYIKYLSEYIDSLNLNNFVEEYDKLSKSKGAYIVNNFIKYCNNKSDIKLHENFLNEDSYTFENIETDYKTLFYERFIFHIRKGKTDINIIEYDERCLNQMLNNIPNIIKKEHNKRTNEDKIIIIWDGLKQFIESDAGLKTKYTTKEFCELLEIPEKYEFKKGRLKEKNGMLLMKMSINDFYYYYLNSYI